MAERPIFVPSRNAPGFVKEISFSIPWASGFAPVQKKKNIKSLHEVAAKMGFAPLLEVSTKSDEVAGKHLSAFHLKIHSSAGDIPLECAYQGSKVFEKGGPFMELYTADPRDAKRDPRLQESGRLKGFEFEGHKFPLQPQSVFYDWLYLSAIYPHRQWLFDRLQHKTHYVGFTDIEFNPVKSINCQARSCALFIVLMEEGLLDAAMNSPESFVETMYQYTRPRIGRDNEQQFSL